MSSELIDKERLVYQVIKNYLNQFRVFELCQIIPYIRIKFEKDNININKKDIKEIISSFLKRKILVEGSSFLREDVLMVLKRKKIYDYIIKNPGVEYSDIVKHLKINNHIIRWHLNILRIFDFIYKIHINEKETYFKSEIHSKQTKSFRNLNTLNQF